MVYEGPSDSTRLPLPLCLGCDFDEGSFNSSLLADRRESLSLVPDLFLKSVYFLDVSGISSFRTYRAPLCKSHNLL